MTIDNYRDEINRIFARYTHRGFVDYGNCSGLANDVIWLIDRAVKEFVRSREYKALFDITNKAFLKWGKTDKDDSAGQTQDFVWYVKEAWDAVYEADDEDMPHRKMFEWFVKHLDGTVIDYMEDEIYEYLIHHFMEPELLQKKLILLTEKVRECEAHKGDWHYDYQAERYQLYILNVMADMKEPIEKIRKYAKTLKRYEVREIMAQIERSYGNIDEAIAIYKDLAAEEDSEQWETHNWHMELKEIYKEIGDDANYRTEVRAAMRLSAGDMALWKEYKGFFGPDEWPEECAKIFESFKLGDCRPFPWYAAENRYELIMESLEAGFSSFSFKEYEKKLKALFPERCLAVLADDTELKAENSKKRSDYRRVASNLRWIQRYPGGDEVAAKMAADFRERYKLRRAMLEELAEF